MEQVGLPTVVQRAYSPEPNPAERVFEETRRWVEGRIYGSIEEKMEAVKRTCGDWSPTLAGCDHLPDGTG